MDWYFNEIMKKDGRDKAVALADQKLTLLSTAGKDLLFFEEKETECTGQQLAEG